MKKALISIFIILICFNGFSQTLTPSTTPGFNSRSTLPVEDKIVSARQHFNLPRYSDTSQANTYGLIDSCGAMIFTYDISAVWYRACYNGRTWIQLTPSGSPSGSFDWKVGGNNMFPGSSGNQIFGITSSVASNYGIDFRTRNETRFILDSTGILAENSNTVPLGIDTATNKLTYSSGGGGGGSSWLLAGNTGTNPLNDFIGTTDNVGLMFKVNGTQAGYIDPVTDNTSFGENTLLNNTTGDNNTAIGHSALQYNTEGQGNTAIGFTALAANISGSSNLGIGYGSLAGNLSGGGNVGIGYGSVNTNRTTNGNTGIGYGTLGSDTAAENTAIGFTALGANVSGAGNIAIGSYSGVFPTDLSNRLYINSISRATIAGDTTKSIIYGAQDDTAANQRLYLNSKIYAPYIPSGVGSFAVRYDTTTKEFTYADTTSGGGSSGITVGTTTITSGTSGRIGYNNAGVYGEYAITGTGNVAMSASPTFTGTVNGADANFTGLFSVGANPLGTDIAASKSGLNIYYNTTSTTVPVSLLMGTTAAFSKSLRFQAYPASYSTSGMEIADNGALFSVGMPFNVGTYSNHASDFWTSNTRRGGISGSGAVDFTGAMRLSNYGAGTATFDASGNITSVSDERLKTAIKPYTSGLKQLLLLKPIQYKWNEKSGNETKETYAGFSAQNVKNAIPYGTGENKDGYLSLQERAIVATLVNAVKEQQQQIEELKREIIKLQNK